MALLRGMAPKSTPAHDRPLEQHGWRQGRPVEDPEKIKRWGTIRAKPSEYLLHVRGGRVRSQSSGQGQSCFKWPGDAVAIIPTSLQRLEFVADQVTIEKVGVEVTGLAVYRIADPLLAYRVLNFSYPERAQLKLEETLTGMFVGATRRLVANLGVEACLQKRKSALATELLAEIAPVVGGRGHPEDPATEGWGVVIDTIEIQQVRILSGRVFEALQAPYRAEIERRAQEARVEADKALRTRQHESEREIAEIRIRAETRVAEQQADAAQQRAERAAADEIRDVERERSLKAAEQAALLEAETRRAALERESAEARAAQAIRRIELGVAEAQALLAAEEVEEKKRQVEAARARAVAEASLVIRRLEAEAERALGEVKAELERRQAENQLIRAGGERELLLAQRLPELANALGEKISEVRIHQVAGADANPFLMLTESMRAILELAGVKR